MSKKVWRGVSRVLTKNSNLCRSATREATNTYTKFDILDIKFCFTCDESNLY